jgi:PAS domain S-box-containing protein
MEWSQFDTVAALVTVLDREGRIVAFNRACERLTGWSAAEVLGRPFWEIFIAPEELVEVRETFANLQAGRFPNEHENYWLTRGGGRRWVAWSNTATLDVRGEVEHVIATGVDISARKRIDDELRRSEERFRVLVDRIPDYAIFMLDAEGRVASWNEGARRITGYPAEEIVGRDFSAYFTPEQIAAGRPGELLRDAATRGHVEDRGWRVRKDGTRFYAEVSVTALRDPDGTLRGFAKVTRDRTLRWKAEQRQRLFDEVSDVLAHALPDYDETLRGIARLAVQSFADICTISAVDDGVGDARRVATTCSDPAKQHVAEGLRSLEPGQTQSVIFPRVLLTRRAELHSLATYLADTDRLNPEYVRLIRELAPNSVIIAPLVSRGRALGLLSLARTRSGEYVEDDLRLAVELGERAGLYIDNARLYRRAQEAVRARDDVMSIVAHDLRNPLNNINIQAQILLRGLSKEPRPSESLRTAASDIQGSVARMGRLIGDLLDAARAEAGQLVQGGVPCDPAKLAAEAVDSVRALAASKELALSSTVMLDLPLVRADPERVHQVFANLIGNAIKFTPPGGSIQVKVERGDGCVAFTVADTGTGIAAEDLPRVFDRYWQGRRSDRRGAGLGLWLCKGIVESHGGTLSVDSAPGQGSRFRFTLPAVRP